MIEDVGISRNFERPGTDLHIAENACCIDYVDTWLSKPVYSLSKSQRMNRSTFYFPRDDTVGFNTACARVSL